MKPIKCRNNFNAFLIVLLIVFHIASPKEFCMAYADITNTEPYFYLAPTVPFEFQVCSALFNLKIAFLKFFFPIAP